MMIRFFYFFQGILTHFATWNRVLTLGFCFLLSQCLSMGALLAQTQVYWVTFGFTDIITRINGDGTDREEVIDLRSIGFDLAFDIDIDPIGEKIYWGKFSTIERANLDGSDREIIVSQGLSQVVALAINPKDGFLFYSNIELGTIERVNLDGSQKEIILSSTEDGVSTVQGMVVDTVHNKLYLTEIKDNTILRSNFDGSGLEVILDESDGIFNPDEIDIDYLNGKIYWENNSLSSTQEIARANLDGSNMEVIFENPREVNSLWDFTLDAAQENIYITQNSRSQIPRFGRILQTNLDGGDLNVIVDDEIDSRDSYFSIAVINQEPAPVVPDFNFLNASTDELLFPFGPGATLNLGDYPNQSFSLEAPFDPSQFQSAVFEVSGEQTFTRVENDFPFTLFGDNNGDFYPWAGLSPGNYTLKATPYEQRAGQGSAGMPITLNFTVIEEYQPTFELRVLDTNQDQVLFTLQDGDVIDLNAFQTDRISIEAIPSIPAQSVQFILDGTRSNEQLDNTQPFTLLANNADGSTREWDPAIGEYTLEVIAYTSFAGMGLASEPFTITFRVDNNVTFTYDLLNALSDQVIGPLQDGDIIDLAHTGTDQLNIQATPSNTVGSLEFVLRGTQSNSQTENQAPYAAFGDTGGDFNAFSLSPGSYTLRTRSFQRGFKQGLFSSEETIAFEVVNTQAKATDLQAEISLFPNPATEQIQLRVADQEPGDVWVTLRDARGHAVFTQNLGDIQESSFDLPKHLPGVYYLEVKKNQKTTMLRVLAE